MYVKLFLGRDFKPKEQLDVNAQVAALVSQAIAVENLCQCYVGWYGALLSIRGILTTV